MSVDFIHAVIGLLFVTLWIVMGWSAFSDESSSKPATSRSRAARSHR